MQKSRGGTELIVTLALAALTGCAEDPNTHSCTLAGCGGTSTLYFAEGIDGDPTPSGELRISSSPERIRPFDCDPNVQPGTCWNGNLNLDEIWSGDTLEIRFNLSDGSISEWEAVPLTFQEHTLEDFNGPGCHGTYYTATSGPIPVPEAAQMGGESTEDAGL